jgi:hypothetical protein
MLTNSKNGYFTITELEVWQVKFIVKYNIILINIGLRERKREREKERKERDHTQAADSTC